MGGYVEKGIILKGRIKKRDGYLVRYPAELAQEPIRG